MPKRPLFPFCSASGESDGIQLSVLIQGGRNTNPRREGEKNIPWASAVITGLGVRVSEKFALPAKHKREGKYAES